jgi:uncharacterized protein
MYPKAVRESRRNRKPATEVVPTPKRPLRSAVPTFVIVILSLFVLGDLLYLALMVSALRDPGLRGSRLRWVGAVMTAGFLAVLVGTLGLVLFKRAAGADFVVPKSLLAAVYLWHLLLLPLLLLLVIAGKSLAAAWSRAIRSRRPAAVESSEGGLSRRRLLRLAAVSVPPAALAATTGFALPTLDSFRIRRMTLPIPGNMRDLDGMTIAHVTDTHLGDFTPLRYYQAILSAVNDLRADLVVHTGDVINVDSDDIPHAIEGLESLAAPLGVYVCEGNHDLIQSPRKFWDGMRRARGVRFLRNESDVITARGRPLQLLGLRWGPGRGDEGIRDSATELAEAARPDAYRILLAHHPHAFDFAPFAHLTLAGHTHGGQLNITKRLSPGALMYRYWSGRYAAADGRQLVVSNGAGNWFPLRINAPAEILHLTLKAE